MKVNACTILLALALASAARGANTLAWDPVTTFTDGSPASHVAYVIFTGPAPGAYTITNETTNLQITIPVPINQQMYSVCRGRHGITLGIPSDELPWADVRQLSKPTGFRVWFHRVISRLFRKRRGLRQVS